MASTTEAHHQLLSDAYYGAARKAPEGNKPVFAAAGGVSAPKLRSIILNKYGKSIPLKTVKQWLDDQTLYQRTRIPKRAPKTARHKYYVTKPHALHEADLLVMDPSRGRKPGSKKFILGIIDGMSRFLVMRPLTKKDAQNTLEAFKDIYEGSDDSPFKGHFPKRLQTDNGSEFIAGPVQAYFKQKGVKQNFRRPNAHPYLIERAFGNVERSLYFRRDLEDFPKSMDWESILGSAVHTYNTTPHQSLSGPSSVKKTGGRTPQQVLDAGKLDDDAPIANPELPSAAMRDPLYALGQKVRVKYLLDRKNRRAVDFRWSEDIATITDIRRWDKKAGRPNCYHVNYQDDYWLHEDDLMPVSAREFEDYTRSKAGAPSLKPKREQVVPDEEYVKRRLEREKAYSREALKAHVPLSTAELGPPKKKNPRLQYRERQKQRENKY